MAHQRLLAGLTAFQSREAVFACATIVRVAGSSYRRPGARLLIGADGSSAGELSAGCLERELVRTAEFRLQGRSAALVSFDSTADEGDPAWGAGFGCNGVVDVLLEQSTSEGARAALGLLRDCVERQRRAGLITVFASNTAELPAGSRLIVREGGALELAGAGGFGGFEPVLAELAKRQLVLRKNDVVVLEHEGRRLDLLSEWLEPPPRLFIGGTAPDAVPLATFAKALGWSVVVWSFQARPEIRERFFGVAELLVGSADELRLALDQSARPLAVVMSHDFPADTQLLQAFLCSKAEYIGVLGPRRRTEQLVLSARTSLGELAVRRRLHAPIGLDLGAETSEEVALAAVAEMQAVLTRSTAARLSERAGAIHEPHDFDDSVAASAE